MKKKAKDILLRFDEINCYETPSKFNYRQLKNEVNELQKELKKTFGLSFPLDDQVQDASFFCDLKIPSGLIKNEKPNLNYSIRISNFGKLTTLNFEEEYSENTITTIAQILDRLNFILIHADDLDEEYDGNFEKFYKILGDDKPTWRIRFFDYL